MKTKKHIKTEYLNSLKNDKNDKNINNQNDNLSKNDNNVSKNDTLPSKNASKSIIQTTKNSKNHEIFKKSSIKVSKTDYLTKENNMSKNICMCGKTFSCKQNLYRHKKVCDNMIYLHTIEEQKETINEQQKIIEKQKETINEQSSNIMTLKKQIELLQQQLQIQTQLQEIEKKPTKKQTNSKNTISTNSNNNSHNNFTDNRIIDKSITDNRTINIVAYVNDNFPNTKPISMLTNIEARKVLKFDETCGHSLEEMIVFQHSKFLLDQFIGDFIVNEYKKNDPTKQQIWSSNVQKLTFIVRQVLNKTDKVWLKDFNGVCVIKHIIDPILEEVKKLLLEHIKHCNEMIEDPNTNIEEFDKIYNNVQHILKIIYEINQKELHNKILKYIAPHFQLMSSRGIIKDLE